MTPFSFAAVGQVLKAPGRELPAFLQRTDHRLDLFRHVVIPGIAVRAVAILLRAMLMRVLQAGVVLACSSMLTQATTWIVLTVILPHLAHRFALPLSKSQAALLATLTCAPTWLVGIVYVLPEEPSWIFVTTRLIVATAMGLGVLLFRRALQALGCPADLQRVITASWAGVYIVTYFGSLIVMGIVANIVLFMVS